MGLIFRLLCWLADQDTARSNAERASALLRERRDEQVRVDAFLVRRRP
jgi:hypothetical protein